MFASSESCHEGSQLKSGTLTTSERQILLCVLDCQPLELLVIVQRDGILRVR